VHWTVRITGAVGQDVMFEMVGCPLAGGPLYAHRAERDQRRAHNWLSSRAAVRQRAVESGCHPERDRNVQAYK
jgi:hypothetical protein